MHFRFTNIRWTRHGYGTIGGFELATIIITCVALIIGGAAISMEKSGTIIIFIIFGTLASLFCIAIVIFSYIGTQTRFFDEYAGCSGDYDGALSIWNAVDSYMYSVDSLLCSKECPCQIDEKTATYYSANSTTAPYFNLWSTSTIGAKRFQDCSRKVLGQALSEYYISNAYFNHTFHPSNFHEYYANMEEYFKCTGFCGTTYFNGKTGSNQKIIKYLFSDLSKDGIPEHFGCLPLMMTWLRKTVNALSAISCFLFVILVALIILSVLIMLNSGSEDDGYENKDEDQYAGDFQNVKNPAEENIDNNYNYNKIQNNDLSKDNEFKPTVGQRNEENMNFNPSS